MKELTIDGQRIELPISAAVLRQGRDALEVYVHPGPKAEIELAPDELLGLQVYVAFREEEWEDPQTGRRQVRLSVPFIGYRSAEEVTV